MIVAYRGLVKFVILYNNLWSQIHNELRARWKLWNKKINTFLKGFAQVLATLSSSPMTTQMEIRRLAALSTTDGKWTLTSVAALSVTSLYLSNALTSYVISMNLAYLTATRTLVNALTLWTFPSCVLIFHTLQCWRKRNGPSLQAGFFIYKCCYVIIIYVLIKQRIRFKYVYTTYVNSILKTWLWISLNIRCTKYVTGHYRYLVTKQ
jgi:hypothetical protein